jgi:hypothetical protein
MFPRHQHTIVVCRGGDLNQYQTPAADALQRPLRSRFQARLSASVRRTGGGIEAQTGSGRRCRQQGREIDRRGNLPCELLSGPKPGDVGNARQRRRACPSPFRFLACRRGAARGEGTEGRVHPCRPARVQARPAGRSVLPKPPRFWLYPRPEQWTAGASARATRCTRC